jgi:hypothetical protein
MKKKINWRLVAALAGFFSPCVSLVLLLICLAGMISCMRVEYAVIYANWKPVVYVDWEAFGFWNVCSTVCLVSCGVTGVMSVVVRSLFWDILNEDLYKEEKEN